MTTTAITAEAAATRQETVDREAAAAIRFDYDPEGFLHSCIHHEGTEHAGHCFLTYCVVCPADQGNGRVSDEARAATTAALAADLPDLPF